MAGKINPPTYPEATGDYPAAHNLPAMSLPLSGNAGARWFPTVKWCI